MKAYSLRQKICVLIPVLLPIAILLFTGFRGLDFGNHWDEKGWQIAPVKRMLMLRAPLPGHYGYPSFNYWVGSAALLPEVVALRNEPDRGRQLREVLESQSYLLRLRSIFLFVAALSILWVYLLVLAWRETWYEAFLAACFLAFSWEVAYHVRWIATDGMLMQFGALTILCTMLACRTASGTRWLYTASVTAGLGMGTKYPGGLLIVPVLIAGYLLFRERPFGAVAFRSGKLIAVFFLVFLISTPAILLRPSEVWQGMLSEIRHYSSGHAGHTVSLGLGHAWQMLVYLGSLMFSHFPVMALSVFGLSIFGTIVLFRHERTSALVFLSFPILYFIYFSTQKAMVVRNLLVLVPFLAILAARGAGAIWEWAGATPIMSWKVGGRIRSTLLACLAATLLLNAGWLFYAAETIVDRKSKRFAIETLSYVQRESSRRFFLSPLVSVHVKQVAQLFPSNVTSNASQADRLLLYASEGMPWWQSWPANRLDLTEGWFGPYEVNFNIYPNWWGDDRIIELTPERAKELGVLICCAADHAEAHASAAPFRVRARLAASGPEGFSWAIPDLEPCALMHRDEAETIMGTLRDGPRPGGTAADGTACVYVGEKSVVATIGVISTRSFEDLKSEPGNKAVAGPAQEMFVARTNAFHDVRLLARQGEVALMIRVATSQFSDEQMIGIANRIATTAVRRLPEILS